MMGRVFPSNRDFHKTLDGGAGSNSKKAVQRVPARSALTYFFW